MIIGTPYWSQGAKKQFYVSKRCAFKKDCERLQRNNMPDCTHIWYQDWKCSSCCGGDRCNYYVIVSIKFLIGNLKTIQCKYFIFYFSLVKTKGKYIMEYLP